MGFIGHGFSQLNLRRGHSVLKKPFPPRNQGFFEGIAVLGHDEGADGLRRRYPILPGLGQRQ